MNASVYHSSLIMNVNNVRLKDSCQSSLPKASIIIVNWNGSHFLERCLTALMSQTTKAHEIILLDNASSDGSLEIVRKFPSVRLIELDQNTGFARGNNLAIDSVAQEVDWIAVINPDAFADPHWLEELLLASQTYPGFEMFGSKLVNAGDPSMLDGAGDAYNISGLVWRVGHGRRISAAEEHVREIFSPCAAAALYQRGALCEVGGFDEDFFCYVEDVDLGFRLRLAGFRCLYVPRSVAHHVGSGTTGGQDSTFSIYYGHRNLVWAFVKNMPGILFWLLLPLHVALNVVSILWFVLLGRGGVIYRAKRDALFGLPKMWHKRRYVQAIRVASIGQVWRLLDKHLLSSQVTKRRRWIRFERSEVEGGNHGRSGEGVEEIADLSRGSKTGANDAEDLEARLATEAAGDLLFDVGRADRLLAGAGAEDVVVGGDAPNIVGVANHRGSQGTFSTRPRHRLVRRSTRHPAPTPTKSG